MYGVGGPRYVACRAARQAQAQTPLSKSVNNVRKYTPFSDCGSGVRIIEIIPHEEQTKTRYKGVVLLVAW